MGWWRERRERKGRSHEGSIPTFDADRLTSNPSTGSGQAQDRLRTPGSDANRRIVPGAARLTVGWVRLLKCSLLKSKFNCT